MWTTTVDYGLSNIIIMNLHAIIMGHISKFRMHLYTQKHYAIHISAASMLLLRASLSTRLETTGSDISKEFAGGENTDNGY